MVEINFSYLYGLQSQPHRLDSGVFEHVLAAGDAISVVCLDITPCFFISCFASTFYSYTQPF